MNDQYYQTGTTTLANSNQLIYMQPYYQQYPQQAQAQQSEELRRAMQAQALQQLLQKEQKAMMSGDKPIVVCGSEQVQCDDMDKAQAKAEELAHKNGANAYILKPVRKVAPKRDVVTTEIA